MQKTAYGWRMSDGSSDVCSSDLSAIYGVRPEHLALSDDGVEAEVIVVEPTGSETQVFTRIGHREVVAEFRERHDFRPGEKIRLGPRLDLVHLFRSEEHTSELQSLMRISYAVFCLQKKTNNKIVATQ